MESIESGSMSMAVVPADSGFRFRDSDADDNTPWGNMTESEFFASLPVYDMFPLSNWENNHVVLYALVS